MATKTRVGVIVKDKNFEKALSIFQSKVKQCGILKEYKANKYFSKPSTIRRRAKNKKIYENK